MSWIYKIVVIKDWSAFETAAKAKFGLDADGNVAYPWNGRDSRPWIVDASDPDLVAGFIAFSSRQEQTQFIQVLEGGAVKVFNPNTSGIRAAQNFLGSVDWHLLNFLSTADLDNYSLASERKEILVKWRAKWQAENPEQGIEHDDVTETRNRCGNSCCRSSDTGSPGFTGPYSYR